MGFEITGLSCKMLYFYRIEKQQKLSYESCRLADYFWVVVLFFLFMYWFHSCQTLQLVYSKKWNKSLLKVWNYGAKIFRKNQHIVLFRNIFIVAFNISLLLHFKIFFRLCFFLPWPPPNVLHDWLRKTCVQWLWTPCLHGFGFLFSCSLKPNFTFLQ